MGVVDWICALDGILDRCWVRPRKTAEPTLIGRLPRALSGHIGD